LSVTYREAIEVALCYGWIDGQKKSESKQHWLQRFVPRTSTSIWSKINRAKALSLIPGTHRFNLHASYGDFGGRKVDRDGIRPEHFNRWAPRSCINDAITHRGEARLGPIRISGRASECKLSDEPHERSSTLIGNERTLT